MSSKDLRSSSTTFINKQVFVKLLGAYLILQIAFYVYSLYQREADIDDAWIGEHAYWMAQNGYAKSELMHGWQQQEERILIHHKLMTLIGSAVIYISGFSLYALKSVSLFFFIAFLALLYSYYKNGSIDKTGWLIMISLLFTFHYTFKFSFIFRPEVMIMFFTFVSFVLLEKVVHGKAKLSSSRSNRLLFFAGLVSGLCGVAHLNGLAVVLAGGILLLFNHDYRKLPLFVLGSIIGFSIYFYDFTGEYGFSFWKQQLFQSVLGNNGGLIEVVRYMSVSFLKEHMRFFHDFSVIGFSLLLILSLAASYKYIQNNRRVMFQYTVILWLIVAFLFTQKSRQYILIYLPFLSIFIADVLRLLYADAPGLAKWAYKKTGKWLFIISLLIFFGGSEYFNYRITKEKFNPSFNRNFVETNIGSQTDTVNIVAPMEFIFNEIKWFNRIQGERLYTTLKQYDQNIYGEGFFRKAQQYDADYIILTGVYRENLGVENYGYTDTINGYLLTAEARDYKLYSRIKQTRDTEKDFK